MKYLIIILMAVVPAGAAVNDSVGQTVPQELAIPMEIDSSSFGSDVESTSEKIRRLLFESRRQQMIRAVNSPQRDPDASQKALETLEKENPEILKEQPHAFSYMRGGISFWKKDFPASYKNYDEAIRTFQKKYPDGFPGGQYYEKNASFVSQMYMGRGTAAMFMGRNEEAVADMDRAMRLAPKVHAFMHMNKCRALVRLGKFREAAEAMDKARGLDSAWLASKPDKPAICDILFKHGQQAQACQAGN
ncbi:MAG: hypothetical protein CVU79_06715 [Elusimicrobia bacterium HGW-Elusimicrobia-3]|jgi:tetratricopeptide (TPR) repeat protein|nr:MAG: hypothetical protein CVU79_06715 [Elusimicrobia bacterium HGW-Elusimicrobia-3]